MSLSKTELAELKRAKALLENPSLAARMSALLGSPIDKAMKMLPARFQKTVHEGIRILCMGILYRLGHLHRLGSDTGLKTQTNFIETS